MTENQRLFVVALAFPFLWPLIPGLLIWSAATALRDWWRKPTPDKEKP